MKRKLLLSFCLLTAIGVTAARSATLGVTATDQPSGALTNYSYLFSITGANAGIDNVFLGSNDLSPLNVVIKVDGAATTNWSYLGNNVPQNYLQFFSTNGSSLNSGDTLGVTFSSLFGPASSQFAIGESSVSGATTNQVTGIAGPASPTPEPASVGLLLVAGITAMAVGRLRSRLSAA